MILLGIVSLVALADERRRPEPIEEFLVDRIATVVACRC